MHVKTYMSTANLMISTDVYAVAVACVRSLLFAWCLSVSTPDKAMMTAFKSLWAHTNNAETATAIVQQ
jgi:hypothetical protein